MRGLLRARHVLGGSFDSEHRAAAVIVDGTDIKEVGPSEVLAGRGPFDWELGDDRSGILTPGFVNGHHHALRPYRLGKRPPMETWLVRARQRRLAPLSDEELYDHTLWGALQMVRSGATSALDHFPLERSKEDFGVSIAAQAYLDSGMRAALCLTTNDQSRFVYDDDERFLESLPSDLGAAARGLYGPFDAERYFSAWERSNEELAPQREKLRLGFGPSGPQWCSDVLLRRLRETASANSSAPIQIHLLESKYQAMYGGRVYGRSVVDHLEDLGFFDDTGVSCAHCVWCSESDLASLARLGAIMVHNPSSNLQLQVGLAPLAEAFAQGVKIGIGCDAGGFEEDLDILLEARLAQQCQVPSTWGGAGISSSQILEMLTSSASDILGLDLPLGKLEAGYRADLVLIDDTGLHMNPYASAGLSVADLVVKKARAEDVRGVVIGGERILVDGEFVSADETSLRERVARSLERYVVALADADGDFERVEPYIVKFYEDWERNSESVRGTLGHPSPLR